MLEGDDETAATIVARSWARNATRRRSSQPGEQAAPGLLRGLADQRVAAAMRGMHGDPAQAWTVAELAKEAGMSRSAFFERRDAPLETVAERVGYGSASTFSTAFRRHVGNSPGRYARGSLSEPTA